MNLGVGSLLEVGAFKVPEVLFDLKPTIPSSPWLLLVEPAVLERVREA